MKTFIDAVKVHTGEQPQPLLSDPVPQYPSLEIRKQYHGLVEPVLLMQQF